MKTRLLATLVFAIILTACGRTSGSNSGISEFPLISEAEVLDLPVELDVQTTAAIQGRNDVILIDVREQWEYDEGHIPDITLIPMSEITTRMNEIPTDKEVVVTCRSGNRSHQVTELLQQNGFENVHNMQGGILAWEEAGLPVKR